MCRNATPSVSPREVSNWTRSIHWMAIYLSLWITIPWSRIPKWSKMEPPYHQCDQQSQQITRHCVQDCWPMSSWSEGFRILHLSEASPGICLSGMGPSLHQGCEQAGRHTKESSSIRHWKEGKDWGNCHTYLARLGMAPLNSPMQSPKTEYPPQGANWRDSFASTGPSHSPAANHQQPSRQENDSNQYIYGHIQIQFLAKNHHGLERHPPRHHTGRAVFLQEKCDGSSDVIRWSVFLAAPIHLYYMFLTNCTKWHNLGVMLPVALPSISVDVDVNPWGGGGGLGTWHFTSSRDWALFGDF